MEEREKIHILFLGLDHRLLWQLTRTLAHLEDRITIDCVNDPAAAKEICDRESVHVIVVDGWELAWNAARHLAGDEAFEGGTWKWIVVGESLPLESLPAGRLSPSALFLEKPFNPKDFPSFLLEVAESREVPEGREPSEPPSEEKLSLPLTPGEAYKEPEGAPPVEGPSGEAAGAEAEMQSPEAASDAFHHHVDEGFTRLGEKDLRGARAEWLKALEIRPYDGRLKANLRRLERTLE